ncbi:MAG: hypothetical protein V1744_05260 [Candidatus Altiarchaeota archaeon]
MSERTQNTVMVLQVALTIILIFVTARYVMLTESIVEASRQQSEISKQQLDLSKRQYQQDNRPFLFIDNVRCWRIDQDMWCGGTLRNVGPIPAKYSMAKSEFAAGKLVMSLNQTQSTNQEGVIFPNQQGVETSYLIPGEGENASVTEKRFKLILRAEYEPIVEDTTELFYHEVQVQFSQQSDKSRTFEPATTVYTSAN